VRVLFVCSGNICRSAMAVEYARIRLASSGLSHVVVDSAGTLGIDGEMASPEALQVFREEGLNLSRHRSRGIAERDLRVADLVIVMALTHLQEIDRRFPAGARRRLLLRTFEHGPKPEDGAPDLDDPIGMPVETYREAFAVIRKCVDHLVLCLKHER
jgi:protein-tyrosine-phosphatase